MGDEEKNGDQNLPIDDQNRPLNFQENLNVDQQPLNVDHQNQVQNLNLGQENVDHQNQVQNPNLDQAEENEDGDSEEEKDAMEVEDAEIKVEEAEAEVPQAAKKLKVEEAEAEVPQAAKKLKMEEAGVKVEVKVEEAAELKLEEAEVKVEVKVEEAAEGKLEVNVEEAVKVKLEKAQALVGTSRSDDRGKGKKVDEDIPKVKKETDKNRIARIAFKDGNWKLMIGQVDSDCMKDLLGLRFFIKESYACLLTKDLSPFVVTAWHNNKDYEMKIVKLRMQEDTYCIGGQGWHAFIKDKGLKKGDDIVFSNEPGKLGIYTLEE